MNKLIYLLALFLLLTAESIYAQQDTVGLYLHTNVDNMDQEYLKELFEKANYENSSTVNGPMSWDYYFKPLFRSYAKGQESNAERLKGTYDRVLAYNKACTDLARRINVSEADKFTTADQIVELLKDISFGGKVAVSETPFKKLSLNERLYLLEKLSEGYVAGRWSVTGDFKPEDIIVKIITTTPKNQINKQFYDKLYNDRAFVERLYEGLDGDNVLVLLGILDKLTEDYGSKENVTQFIYLGNANGKEYEGNTFLYDYPYILTDKSGWNSSGNLNLHCIIGRPNILPLNVGDVENRKEVSKIQSIHPLGFLKVYFDNENNVEILPAVYAYHLGVRNNREEALSAVDKSVILCSSFISLRMLFNPLSST